ncbi:MAG: lipopolysaccharide kinase InaA family protein [Planctomycetota bacterium]|jgi:tRNA A-37 threonylcarbamoyl transferase component Bud32
MARLPIPDGFSMEREGDLVLVLRDDLAKGLRSAGVADPDAAAERSGAEVKRFKGRGRPVSLSVPGHDGVRVVIRRYLHGGLLRGLTGGLFPGARRFLRELRTLAVLHGRDAPVPEPFGLVVEEVAAGAVRGWILTREIAGVRDLREVLLETEPGDAHRRRALEESGRAVRLVHDAGLLHADLHVKNILVRDGGGPAVVVDLDGANLLADGLGRDQRASQIQRLDRSMVKMTVREDAVVSRTERRRLVLAYCGDDRSTPEERERWTKKYRSQLARHRLGWKLGAG